MIFAQLLRWRFLACILCFCMGACSDDTTSPMPTETTSSDASLDGSSDVVDRDTPTQDASPDVPNPSAQPRVLGLALIPNSSDLSLSSAWSRARDLGAGEPGDLNLDWATFETSPNTYTDPDNTIQTLLSLPNIQRLSVTLAPFQTTYTSLPEDLRNRPWDDPELMDRYLQAAQNLLQRLNTVHVYNLAVGNEVDLLLGDDPEAWRQWARLVAHTRDGLRAQYPDLHVSTKMTLPGWLNPNAQPLLDESDAIIATLYPLDDTFHIRPTTSWIQDLNTLVAHSDLPIYLAEFGVPSSATLDSSPDQQAEAFRALFQWWDTHPEQVRAVIAVWSADLPDPVLDALIDAYGIDDPNFRAFLGSLGLRTQDNTPKPAWDAIHTEICSRNFVQSDPNACNP